VLLFDVSLKLISVTFLPKIIVNLHYSDSRVSKEWSKNARIVHQTKRKSYNNPTILMSSKSWAQVVGGVQATKEAPTHPCEECGSSFKCLGELPHARNFCQCALQEVSDVGLVFWCSRYCMILTDRNSFDT
jgi:hypothetical protein